jgi:subtilisin family serine protease
VGALDSDGSDPAPFSNFGWWVDACAIGERVESAFIEFDGPLPPTGDYDRDRFRGYATWSGTSFAAPKVAGAIAQLAAERGIPASEAADRILDPAEHRSMPDLGVVVGVPGITGA